MLVKDLEDFKKLNGLDVAIYEKIHEIFKEEIADDENKDIKSKIYINDLNGYYRVICGFHQLVERGLSPSDLIYAIQRNRWIIFVSFFPVQHPRHLTAFIHREGVIIGSDAGL